MRRDRLAFPIRSPPETAAPARDRAGRRNLDTSSPVFIVDHSACVLCDRCVRACDDVMENHVIGRTGKGTTTGIGFDLNDRDGRIDLRPMRRMHGLVSHQRDHLQSGRNSATSSPGPPRQIFVSRGIGAGSLVRRHAAEVPFVATRTGRSAKPERRTSALPQSRPGNTAFIIKSGGSKPPSRCRCAASATVFPPGTCIGPPTPTAPSSRRRM